MGEQGIILSIANASLEVLKQSCASHSQDCACAEDVAEAGGGKQFWQAKACEHGWQFNGQSGANAALLNGVASDRDRQQVANNHYERDVGRPLANRRNGQK